MEIIKPFPVATARRKFLIVAIDYFTKWIEAKPLNKWHNSFGRASFTDMEFHELLKVIMEDNLTMKNSKSFATKMRSSYDSPLWYNNKSMDKLR